MTMIFKQYLQKKHVGKLFEVQGKQGSATQFGWTKYQAKILNPALYLLFTIFYSLFFYLT